MQQIIVTGGAGFIGSHTVVELLNNNYEVIVIDNLVNSSIHVIEGIKQITGKTLFFEHVDILDVVALRAIFLKYKNIVGVIHFAAYKAVGESVQQPLKYYQNNVTGLINMLQCMQDFKIKYFIFSSSCTVYGNPVVLPVSEDTPIQQSCSPYGNTKQIGEEIITDTVHANVNMQAVLLRYFNPVGAHESTIIGELPLGVPNNLVPYITQTAIGIREQLKVFGNDYNTPDGTGIRDYIHVVDLAKAHVLALEFLFDDKNTKSVDVFNLGTGTGYSVLEVIHSFEKVSQQKLNYIIAPRRAGDIDKIFANPVKANAVLKWTAKYSLDDMMLSAWKWQQKIS